MTSNPKTSQLGPKRTSLQGSGSGPTPSGSPESPTTPTSGRGLALASRLARQAQAKEKTTLDTSGPSGSLLLSTTDLQSSLESKLRARLEGLGSPLYKLTWKHWDIPSGLRICALRARVPRTSDRDSSGERRTGWTTPSKRDWKDTPGMALSRLNGRSRSDQTPRQAFGILLNGEPVGTGSNVPYNPAFSRWLMGLPPEWDDCAPMETPSSRK
jgi:hypothetical protein